VILKGEEKMNKEFWKNIPTKYQEVLIAFAIVILGAVILVLTVK